MTAATKSLKDFCKVASAQDDGDFVGVNFDGKEFKVVFPIGYRIESDSTDAELRKGIRALLHSFAHTQSVESDFASPRAFHSNGESMPFPIHTYLHVVRYFLSYGYYREQETIYRDHGGGKIHWGRTIKQVKPQVVDANVVYLTQMRRKSFADDRSLIARVFHYCAWRSFNELGCILYDVSVPKPDIEFNESLFESVIHDALDRTFNERSILLFRNMLDLVKCWGHNEHSKGFRYGTKEFHVVWEKMVDSVFGNVGNKEDYNPKLVYNTRAKDSPHPIIPDTIMILGKDEMFILDSKYYKFAMGEHPDNSGLPGSDSILKQIAYARYAQNMHKGSRIYNAFVMPYNERFSEAFRYPCEGKAVDSDAMQSTEHSASSGESVLPMCIAGYCDATALAPTHSTPDNSCTDDAETRQVPFYKILLVLIDTTALLNHFADIKKDDARNALANMIHYAQRRS
mgnify:CR=1 FL=1